MHLHISFRYAHKNSPEQLAQYLILRDTSLNERKNPRYHDQENNLIPCIEMIKTDYFAFIIWK